MIKNKHFIEIIFSQVKHNYAHFEEFIFYPHRSKLPFWKGSTN